MLQISKEKEAFLDDVAAVSAADASGPDWLRALRQRGAARFAERDLPSTRDEDWKYTSIAPITRNHFRGAHGASGSLPTIDGYRLGASDWAELVFVDGELHPELGSLPSGWPEDAVVRSLRTLLDGVGGSDGEAAARRAAREYLGDLAPDDASAFVALNTAHLRDAAVVHVPERIVLETPIHVLFVTTAEGEPVAAYPRLLLVVGRSAQATLIESHVSFGSSPTLNDAVSELVLHEGAALAHYKLVREADAGFHVGMTRARLERDSTLTSFVVCLGGALVRNDLQLDLAEPGAACDLYGLYVAGGEQHVDNHTTIEHTSPHGTSRQFYAGVLDGRSRGVFNGKVLVRPGAVATDAQQTNRNLILSDQALVNTKPQLEILDDDVKCSHGATIGRLDEDQVFYLRSRGLDTHRARTLLTYGFANDVIEHMKLENVRVELDRLLLSKLDTAGEIADLA